MKRITSYLTLALTAVILCSCMEDELHSGISSDRLIRLTGYVPSPVVATKASGIDYIYDYSESTGEEPFSFIRWDQGGSTDPLAYTGNVLAATLGDPIPSDGWVRYVEFEDPQYFDSDKTKECGFAGCYPPVTDENWVKDGGAFVDSGRKMTYNIDGETDVMVSDFKKGSHSTGIEPITFKHGLCLYKIYAYAMDQDAKDLWGKLDAVTLINLPDQLYVTLPDDITDENKKVNFTYSTSHSKRYLILDEDITAPTDDTYPVGKANGVGLDLPSGYSTDNLQYVGAILGGSPDKVLGINVTMDNPEVVAESAVSIARNFQPGYTYNIILRFSTHGIINASVTVEDWPDNPIEVPEGGTDTSNQRFFTNLSRYGTANSYVVSSANMGYAFDCTVKGNGINVLTDWNNQKFNLQDTNPDINPEDIASVKVIWSDVVLSRNADNSWAATEDNQHDYALLNLMSEKPVDNKILFEVVGFDTPDDYRLKYKGNALIGAYDADENLIWSWHIWVTDKPINLDYDNGFISQDRNLGAVSSDYETHALNRCAVSGLCYQWGRKDPFNADLCTDDSHNHAYKVTVESGPVTMSVAHANPRTFYSTDGDWCSNPKDYQWGYLSDQDEMVKTMYDPCPPGYRVNGNPLWELQSNENTEAPVLVGNNAGYTFNIGGHTTVYYPASHYFEDSRGEISNLEDSDVYQYSANHGYLFHYPPESAGQTLSQVNCSGAYPVRCVLENSKKAITDLSREQSANCYLVENRGYYKFNAKVPGNAVGSLSVQKDGGGFQTVEIHGGVGTTLNDVVKVDVLWWQGDLTTGSSYLTTAVNSSTQEEFEDSCPVTMLDYNTENEVYNLDDKGYAYFEIDKDKMQNANVILAGFDVNGNIKWTWHIWMLPGGVDVVRFGKYSVMDRNVGATFAPTSASEVDADNVFSTYGFYYQWGRKDPFVPPASHTYNDTDQTSSKWIYKNPENGQWSVRTEKLTSAGAVSIQTLNSNPITFYTNENGPCQNSITEPSEASHLWGYTGLTGTASYSSAKTMWDPCPPGYKLIDHTTLDSPNLWSSDSPGSRNLNPTSTNGFGLFITNSTQLTWNYGYSNTTVDTDESGFWLPFSRGIIENGDYLTVSSSPEGQLHTLCPFNGYINWPNYATDRSRSLLYNGSILNHNNNHYQSRGKTVRCQKE